MTRLRKVLFAAAILGTAGLPRSDLAAQSSSDTEASAPDEVRFETIAGRYRQILQRRPRKGTAFDLWYRHYFDAGRVEELVESVERSARERQDEPGAQLLLGLVLERHGKDDQALAAYGAAEKLAPDDYYPPYLRGALLVQENQFDAAAEALARALSLKPPRTEALEIAKALGRVQFRRGETDEALETWSQVAAQFPRDRQVLEELARLLAQEEQYDEAIRRWQQIAELVRDDPADRLQAEIEIAQLHVEKGSRKTAVEMLSEALGRLKPESWQAQDVRKRIEDAFLRDEDLAGLIVWCEDQLKGRPEDLDAMQQLARAQAMAGRRDEALQTYERAVRLAPSRKDLRESLISELVRKRDFAQAISHSEELAKQHPGDADVLRRLGELHLGAAAPAERAPAEQKAVEVWKRIAAIRPDDAALALQTAEACRRAAQARWLAEDETSPLEETAEQYYREAIRRASGAPHYHEYLGEFLHEQGRKDEAAEAWAKIAAPPNDTAENCHRLSEVYARFGHLEEALEASQRSLALDPQNFRYRNDRIGLLLRAKRFDEAVQHVEELQRLADEPVQEEQARTRAVEVYAASGRIDGKVAELRGRLAGGEGSVEDRLLLALLLIEQRAVAAARETLATALESSSDDIRLLRLQAAVLQQTGDQAGAVTVYHRLTELDRTHRADHYAQIVQLELNLGRVAEAQRAAERLVELSPSNLDAWRLRAQVAFQMNDPEGGLATLRRALQVAPRDLDIRMQLARALVEQRQPKEAVEHYWRCFELADSLHDKRLVVGAMADLSPTVLPHADLIAQLERLQARAEDSKVLALCVIEAYRRSKMLVPARRELLKLLEQRPNDADALQLLVSIAEEQQKWADAVSWQERLVALTPEPRELEKLARLAQQAGNSEKAIAIWMRALRHSGDETSLVTEIDRRLNAGEFEAAVALAEQGLEEAPASWRLHHRAGCAHYALQRWDDSVARFEQAFSASANVQQPSDPVRELRAAMEAHSRFQRLQQFRQFLSRVRNASARQFPRGLAPTWSNDASEVRLDSLEAIYSLAGRHGGRPAWIEAQRRGGPVSLRDLVLVLYANSAIASTPGLLEELSRQSPDDPLPHLARLLEPADPRALALLGSPERRRRRDGLQASFKWICERRPELKREVLFSLGAQLSSLGFAEATTELLMGELRALKRVQDLQPVAELAARLHSPGFRERFIVRAAELIRETPRTLPTATVRTILEMAIAPGHISANNVDERVAAAAITVWKHYSSGLSGPATTFSYIPAYGNLSPLVGRNLAARGMTVPALRISPIQAARVAFDQFRQQQASLARLTGTNSASVQRTLKEQQDRLLQQLRSLGLDDADQILQPFPTPGRHLDTERFLALYRLYLWLDDAGRAEQLIARLERMSSDDTQDEATVLTARAFVLWWSNRREEAIEVVRGLCESSPDDVDLKVLLARAYLADSRLQDALAVLNELDRKPRSATNFPPSEIDRLKADVARGISEAARLAVLRGHEHVVRAVAWAPDGKTIASASYDGTLRLWDAETKQTGGMLEGHQEFVFCLAFSPDGKQIASAGIDGPILLWNPALLASAASLAGHEAGVRSLEYSPNGDLLLSAGDDHTVRIWNLADLSEASRLRDHPPGVVCAGFSPDGKLVATGTADGTVRLWNVASGEITKTLKAHSNVVRCLSFSPDGKLLATGSDDNSASLWDVATGARHTALAGHADTVFDVAFAPDGKWLATASGDRTIRLWDATSGRLVATLTGHTNAVSSVRFSPGGGRLASGSYDRTVRLWRTRPEGERGASAP